MVQYNGPIYEICSFRSSFVENALLVVVGLPCARPSQGVLQFTMWPREPSKWVICLYMGSIWVYMGSLEKQHITHEEG